MPRCVIIGAGPVQAEEKALVRPGDYIIACDAGYKNAQALGLVPALIVGDFDSAPQPGEGELVVLPAEKDDTDTHYAARLAVQKGFDEVLILGVLGGSRMDHTFAAIAAGLWLAKQGVAVSLAGQNTRVRYALPGRPVALPHDAAGYFSVFPLEGEAAGVCESGAKYPLQNARLVPASTLGASNETLPGGAVISVQSGSLLVVCTQKER